MTTKDKKTKIYITPRFVNILLRICSESWIAAQLLNGVSPELLVDDPINYLDISQSDSDKISYLTDKKLHEAVKFFSDEHFGKGSNKSIGLENLPLELRFKAKGRVKIKFGSFVNKLFKDVPPKDVEKFASLLKSVMNQPDFSFKIISGAEIPKYYHQSYHSSTRGSLGVSCMRHDHCKRLFELYKNNPNFVKMLVMFDRDGLVLSRALLWDLGKENGLDGDFKFMDRIYTTKDDQTHLFIDWAKENGYAYKEKQSWNTPHRFQFKDEIFEKRMKVSLPNWNYSQENGGHGLPYLDTFKWVNLKDGTMYNYKPQEADDKRSIYTSVSTNGEVYGFNYLKEDSYHNEYWYEGEIKWIDYLQMDVCERYLQYSNINKTYLLKAHAIIENYIGDYIFNEEYDKFNNRELIDGIIAKRKEEERIRLEKLRKSVMDTLPFFRIYVNSANAYLNGETQAIRPDYSDIDGSKSTLSVGVGDTFIDYDSTTLKQLFGRYTRRVTENPQPEATGNLGRLEQINYADFLTEQVGAVINQGGDVEIVRDNLNELRNRLYQGDIHTYGRVNRDNNDPIQQENRNVDGNDGTEEI